ncbi:hypothetical protein BDK51DRAFT_42674 [Blyttiomyces helicus]|uniref:Uncharacterized protein n=1 Tax=Blyttiomyces helicus TaxID=388810 RepID=A0A4P9W7A6_9FUNG|nr:hypothetical protein BDK51DRAFT_42674 [Blyttiomyces helicus]|eukprot:RKO86036.1 hypothetical protein BDK51DRAFT_42674 [Blyttiomyces helicus]
MPHPLLSGNLQSAPSTHPRYRHQTNLAMPAPSPTVTHTHSRPRLRPVPTLRISTASTTPSFPSNPSPNSSPLAALSPDPSSYDTPPRCITDAPLCASPFPMDDEPDHRDATVPECGAALEGDGGVWDHMDVMVEEAVQFLVGKVGPRWIEVLG